MASAARAMERIEDGAGTTVRRFIAPSAPARDRLSERLVAAVARPRAFRSS
jgi:hypothetical protein